MSTAPLEYTPEWHDEVNLGIHSKLKDIKDSMAKFDTRQYLMLVAALGQAGTFVVGLVFAVIKFM